MKKISPKLGIFREDKVANDKEGQIDYTSNTYK